jgi:WD40-like Beta Propeller Repeat
MEKEEYITLNYFYMKKAFYSLILLVQLYVPLITQQTDYSLLTGKYLGQKEPGMKVELFAPGIVSVGEGVHGNIVFTPDFTQAAWHPNYPVYGKALIYIMRYRNGKWEAPAEFFLQDGFNYSEPFFSHDGKRLYYLSGKVDPSGNAENEKIFFVKRQGEGWSEPKLLSEVLPAFHWQFSLDTNNNLYFGGSSPDKKAEIYYSQNKNGEYLKPVRLPATINSEMPEFSPAIAPDNSYLVFIRSFEQKNSPPMTNLFVSFRDSTDNWTEAQNLTAKTGTPVKTPSVIMGAPRISPDGKYLFFSYFNGKAHMVYWISAKIIEEMRPKDL